MADIHIGRITRITADRGRAQLFYHIPMDAPVSGVAPTPTSAIPAQLQQDEIDALAAGSLIEVSRSMVVLTSQTQAEIANAVRADWQTIKSNYSDKHNFAYKFYGVTLNATA